MLFDDTHLIRIGGVGREIEVCGNAGEGVLLVAHRLLEVLTRAAHELLYGLFRDVACQRQGVDEHTHRVRQTEV